jgi:glycosyltransferase involved in cell wall biosynthesis
MLIGIDGIPLRDIKTGVGHYTFELAKSLALVAPEHHLEILSPFHFESSSQGENAKDELPSNLQFTRVKVNLLERNWWTIGLPRYIKRKSFDLFHGTNFDIPLWRRCPTVLTVHDLSSILHPETHETRPARRERRRLPLMVRSATQIVTHSESVRREIVDHLHAPAEKVVAIPAAARSIFRPLPPDQTVEPRRRLGVEDEFLLFVGTIEPRKNLVTLLNAYQEVLRATGLQPQLVIAGKSGWLTDEVFNTVRRQGIEERVRFTGYISDSDLCALYSSCRIFIYPSIYEGFGLPPLEAMACGAPVITSAIPSISEVVGDAAQLVAPRKTDDLAHCLARLLGDERERQRLSLAGLQRARKFSWNQTAQLMLGVYREARHRHASEKN